jgi:hypothetical protein
LKRTLAAFTILLGLTTLMIGLYIGGPKIIAELLRNYSILLP